MIAMTNKKESYRVSLTSARLAVTFETLYKVVDWTFTHCHYDPCCMVIPKDQYPRIEDCVY